MMSQSDKTLDDKLNELVELIDSEGATRTDGIREFILETTKEWPEFRELAMTTILLREGLTRE